MQIRVNGSEHLHEGSGTAGSLLDELSADRDRVAVAVNDRVLRKEERDSFVLKEGDIVEIFTFAGGG
jgi:sulfur carrier protein